MLVKKKYWENCISVCTDGTASIPDYNLGVVAQIKEAHKEMLFTYCAIHLEHLAAKKLI